VSPARNSTFWSELGPGGLSSLTVAAASVIAGLGVPIALRLRTVLAAARAAPGGSADGVLVLGRELVDDRPSAVFRARLEHGAALLAAGRGDRIVVSGGWTGTATRSEAAAGREVLLELGVAPERIWTEEQSRHTLENLSHVRATLAGHGLAPRVALVTDPLHLARATALARGLGLDVQPAPARAAPPRTGSPGWWARALREACLLHWYHVGVAFSRAIRSERMLSRVT
jgi:uncharacterized SAM-binding protein YcdF (DUF218 family)